MHTYAEQNLTLDVANAVEHYGKHQIELVLIIICLHHHHNHHHDHGIVSLHRSDHMFDLELI
jgi:hypothetical protein